MGALVVALVASMASEALPGSDAKPKSQKYVPKPSDFTIICTLFKGDPPGSKSPVIETPVTYDPRFAIGARVEEVRFGRSPWAPGSSVRFAIHSPTLLFGGVDFAGVRYSLTFSPFRPLTKDDKVWYEPDTRYLLRWIEKADERP